MAPWVKVLACCQSQQSEFGPQEFGKKKKQTTVELFPDVHNTLWHSCACLCMHTHMRTHAHTPAYRINMKFSWVVVGTPFILALRETEAGRYL